MTDPETRICKECGETKPLELKFFELCGDLSFGHMCRLCRNRRTREYNRKIRRTKQYGIDFAELERLYAEQNGRCAICEKEIPLINTRADKVQSHIDHAHDETKRVRGILCFQCNSGLGSFRDNPELLLRAARYL